MATLHGPGHRKQAVCRRCEDFKRCEPPSGDMTLPVSSYEELLVRVRSLRHETIQLQRELSASSSLLLDHNDNERLELDLNNSAASTPGLVGVSQWVGSGGVATLDDVSRGCLNGLRAAGDGWSTSASSTLPEYQQMTTTESLLARLNLMPKPVGHCNKEGSMQEPKEEDEKNESKNELEEVETESNSRLGASRTEQPSPGQQEDEERRPALPHDSPMSTSEPGCDRDRLTSLYHGTWPVEHGLWHSGPSSLGAGSGNPRGLHAQLNGSQEISSTVSFTSSNGAGPPSGACSLESERRSYSSQQLGHKVDMVYNLLSMLRHERQDMSRTLLAMSSSPESCAAMRQSGCLPLLVQLLHSPGQSAEVRARAARALRNVVQATPEPDRRGRREARVLRLLEQLREYCETLRATLQGQPSPQDDETDHHPGPAIAALMKLSFDEEHRHAMCHLGGLLAVAELIQMDHEAHGGATSDQACVTLRRFAGMALTNLTFGDGANKALLCSLRPFMRALVAQLASPSEDLRQVTASVLRNLSWRADGASKQALREVGAVPALVRAAMAGTKEATLKSILSALWNLSAHCSMNKVDICEVEGALGFLVDMLSYEAPSKTLAIVENAGGILRNISSHIAVREDYRQILREHNCLQTLLQQLKSPSLTVVSNACGALWNLSAHSARDQRALWELGAVAMLRSLVHSKHKMISMGSSAALKNLLAARPHHEALFPMDATAKGMGLPQLPSLYIRKQRALEQELDQTLAETCDNIEPSTSPPPTGARSFHSDSGADRLTRSGHRASSFYHQQHSVSRSESKDSVTSTHSDSVFERAMLGSRVPPSTARLLRHRGLCPGTVPEEDRGSTGSRERRSHSLPHAARLSSEESRGVRPLSAAGEIQTEPRRSDSASPEIRSGYSSLRAATSSVSSERFDRSSTSNTVATVSTTTVRCEYVADVSTTARNGLPTPELSNDTEPYPPSHGQSTCHDSRPSSYKCALVSTRVKAGAMYKKKLSSVYGDYAETDLDQPTDYSLQYQEEEDEESAEAAHRQLHGSDQDRVNYYSDAAHEDTLKTYCTEGTPYETPYNFSTATSMSDLRCEPPTPQSEKVKEEEVEAPHAASDDANPAEEEVAVERQLKPTVEVQAEATPAGFVSPEKPVAYCEEGTPCFSRVSSLSSLASHPAAPDDHRHLVGTAASAQAAVPTGRALHPQETVVEEAKEQRDGACANKVVTFAGAEETPLMFSRCSSLGSLSSFEQHSIHDDRSSVISDFSRRTSGAVSPSELPDSPTQTVPPSPGPHHSGPASVTGAPARSGHRAGDFVGRLPERTHLLPAARHHVSGRSNAPKASVFEDDVAAFKEEDTPVEFSRATSLSSLTIDDEPKISNDTLLKEVRTTPRQSPSLQVTSEEDGTEKQDREKGTECGELPPVSEGEEEADEDMLNACISVGMPGTGRQRHYDRLGHRSAGHANRSPGRPSGIPLKVGAGPRRHAKVVAAPQPQNNYVEQMNAGGPCEDTVRTYCTEGTPAAGLSHAGSRSDLSVLSLPGTGTGTGDLSDDNLSAGGDDNMLAECIQSGMPKAKTPSTTTVLHRPVAAADTASAARVVPRRASSLSSRLRVPPPGQAAQDELETFATEDSPHNFSVRSSLSDLTTGSGEPAVLLKRPSQGHPVFENGCSSSSLPVPAFPEGAVPPARGTSPSSLDATTVEDNSCQASEELGVSCASASEEVQTVLSRGGSLSSLSVDSLGSTEPTPSEQALLEQCINSGMPKSRGSSSRAAACRIPLPVDRNMQAQKAEVLSRTRNHEHGIAQLESRMAVLSLRTADDDGSRPPKNERLPPPPPAAAQTAADGGGGASTTTTVTTTDTATTSTKPTEQLLPRAHPPTGGAPDSSPSVPAGGLPAAVGRVCGVNGRLADYESCRTETASKSGSTASDEMDNRLRDTDTREALSAGDSGSSVNKTDVEIRRCRVAYTGDADGERLPSEERLGGDVFVADGITPADACTSDLAPVCVDNRLLDATVRETRTVRNVLPCHSPGIFVETDKDEPLYDNDIRDIRDVMAECEVFSNETEAYLVESRISADCSEDVKDSADGRVTADEPSLLESELKFSLELPHSTPSPDKLRCTDQEYLLGDQLDISPNHNVMSLNVDVHSNKTYEFQCDKGHVPERARDVLKEQFVSDGDELGSAEEEHRGVDAQVTAVCDSAENILNLNVKEEDDSPGDGFSDRAYVSEPDVVNLGDLDIARSVLDELDKDSIPRNVIEGESAEHLQVAEEACTDISDVMIGLLDNLERAEGAVGTIGVADLSCTSEAKLAYKTDLPDEATIQSEKFASVPDVRQEVKSSLSRSEAVAAVSEAAVTPYEIVGPRSESNTDSLSDVNRHDGDIPAAVGEEVPCSVRAIAIATPADASPRRGRRDCKPSIQRLLSDIQEHTLVSPTEGSGLQLGLESTETDLEMPANVVPDDRTYSLDSLSPDSNLNRPNIATPGSYSSESKQKESPSGDRLPEWPTEENAAAKVEGAELAEGAFGSVRPRLPTGDHTISDVDSVQTPSPLDAGGPLGRTGVLDSAIVMRQSYGAGDTWNEEVSPNDVSFPSLTVPEGSESTELDAVRPPSLMTSLISMTTSSETGAALAAEAEAVAAAINVTTQQSGGSVRQNRKRSLPSLMVRRALGSLENLSGDNGCVSASSSCTSQLDHVRPPADMESSMLSVASITSEVAEVEEDLPDGGASCSTGGEDLTESGSGGGGVGGGGGGGTASPVTYGTTAKPASQSRIATRQTPRQRRQAARDRYRTYTVNTAAAAAAELHATVASETVEEAVEATTPLAEEPPPSEISPPPENETGIRTGTYRITPKQRRQEDRQRFQTQVLDKPAVAVTSPTTQGRDIAMSPPTAESTPMVAAAATRKHRRSAESRDRFRTRTLDGDRDLKAAEDAENHSPPSAADELLLNSLLEREAHILAEEVETLRTGDSLLLECETLSLVSIDSENTSESGHGVEGSNGDEDAEVEVEVEVEVEAGPPHAELLHPMLDDEGEEGDVEEKTLRAGGCDTPDPDEVLGLGEAEEAAGPRRQRTASECVAYGEAVPAEVNLVGDSPVAAKEEEREEGLSENSEDQSSSTDDEECAQKKPRIVKPVTRSRDGSADGSPKPIRGRRKPLRAGRSGIPVTAVAPIKVPVVQTAKVPQQKLQQPKQQQQQQSQIPVQQLPVAPAPLESEQQQPDPRFRPPERQGTFTKDEPTAVTAAKPTVATAAPPEQNRKKRRPVTAGRPTTSASAVTVGAQAASAPTSAKRGTARREATSKIAGLWKKAEESKTKQKQQQQLQKREARGGGSAASHVAQSATAQKASSTTGRGRTATRALTSRIPTVDSAAPPTRTEKVARKELTSAATRTERGGQTTGRGTTGIASSLAKPRRVREDPATTVPAQAPHAATGPGRPFARPANPRPASAIVQPFNYSPPTSQIQQPPPVRSQIPTLVKREEPPLQLNTASIRITTV
ncbi:uncharacterized protein LOC126427981 [Schistocerca serialis cubense]|uniref:uncharacterized protein LOC126427981 n=1 Tax=Schistocerca serialis cubense TaxID=2023355 RepID=UPI00214F032B|nr:uncharacterized protein LOC126427981 [Schistocerca serialis cubense]